MDSASAVLLGRLLTLGLVIESALTATGYVVTVTGGRHDASGVAETLPDAFWHASWRRT